MKQTGKAVVNGQEWTVRPQDETQVIRKGELIEVVKISGVKLIVKRVKEA
ncbi:NfeD family protein [Extibacter muris]